MKRDGLQIETAIEIDRSNDVSSITPLSLKINKRHNKAYTHCKVGTATKSVIGIYVILMARHSPNPLTPCPAPGVAAGVVGVTPLPLDEASTPFCCC